MPSLFEPCGLTQIIAFHYGTIPIVRETGGLKDTVIPLNEFEDTGDGFSFSNYNGEATLSNTVNYSKYIYFEQPEALGTIWWQERWKRIFPGAYPRSVMKNYIIL